MKFTAMNPELYDYLVKHGHNDDPVPARSRRRRITRSTVPRRPSPSKQATEVEAFETDGALRPAD